MAGNDNRCACPNPPGGYTVCGPRQLAICRIVDGEIDSRCVDPPVGGSALRAFPPTHLANWLLSEVTGERRSPDEPLSGREISRLQIARHLAGEQAELIDVNGNQVAFLIPAYIAELVRDLDEGLGVPVPAGSYVRGA